MHHPSVLSLLTVLVVLLPAVLCRSVQQQARVRRTPSSISFKSQRSSRTSSAASMTQKSHLLLKNAPPESLMITQYDTAMIECEAGGNPPPTIHWLKDGHRIHQESNIGSKDNSDDNQDENPIIGLGLTRSRLYVDCATQYDEAVYTCVAENPYKRVSTDTKVKVVRGEGHRSSSSCLAKKSFVSPGTPARITMWTHARLEMRGSTVHLFCRTAGTPEPDVIWFDPDNNPIKNSDKYRILDNGDLEIRDINWDDMGGYVCVAENSHGSDKTVNFLYPTHPGKV